MKPIIIKQPRNDDMGASFNVLISFLEQINNAENEQELTFDLTKVNFTYPFFLLPVAAAINDKRNSGINVKVKLNTDIQGYTNIIRFPEGLNPMFNNNWKAKLKSFANKTYLPVCAIPAKTASSYEREDLLTAFSNTLINQLGLTGSIISSLEYLLSEAIDNIVDHAETENAWLMVQNYPQKKFLDVCVVDTGKGILQTYKDSGYTEVNTDEKAMKSAVNGKSTKDMKERGFGISTSRRMLVKGLGGKYFLFSGSAFYIWTKKHETITNIKNPFRWKGTMLALRIPRDIPENFNLYDYLE